MSSFDLIESIYVFDCNKFHKTELKTMCLQRDLSDFGSKTELKQILKQQSDITQSDCFTFLHSLDPRPNPSIEYDFDGYAILHIGGRQIFTLESTTFIQSVALVKIFCISQPEIDECSRLLGSWYSEQGRKMLSNTHFEFNNHYLDLGSIESTESSSDFE